MKRTIFNLIALSLILVLGSCEKETENISSITYFPDFVMTGESEIIHTLGAPYTDGAVTATESGKSLEVKVSVVGEFTGYKGAVVNTNVADKYIITYAATNSDGFDGIITRTVYVAPPAGDLVTSIEGMYYGNVQRAPSFAVTAQYSNLAYIFITKTGANTYEISDALGGYYFLGRAYGYNYAAQGTVITAVDIAANNFTFTQAEIPGFGNVVDLSEFVVDAASKTISFTGTANFANGTFKVQLKQVQY